MTRIALPVFSGSAIDTGKVIDAYTDVSSDVRNALTPQLSAFGSSLSDALGGVLDTVNSVGSALLGNGIDLNTAKDRIQQALGGSRAGILNLANGLQQSIYSELTGLVGGTNQVKAVTDLYDSIKVITTQGERVFKGDDYKQASAIMDFVSDLTGNSAFQLFDMGAEAAVFKGAIEELGKWGVPELLDDVLAKTDSQTRKTAIRRAAGSLKRSADIDSVQTLIAQAGASTLIADNPDFPQVFLANYRLKIGTTPDQYAAKLDQLVQVLSAMAPDWFTTQRAGAPIYNYRLIGQASHDARALFVTSSVYRAAALAAPFYSRSQSVQALLRGMYPMIPLS